MSDPVPPHVQAYLDALVPPRPATMQAMEARAYSRARTAPAGLSLVPGALSAGAPSRNLRPGRNGRDAW